MELAKLTALAWHGVDRNGQVVMMTIVVTMTGIAAACLIAAWILDCRGK